MTSLIYNRMQAMFRFDKLHSIVANNYSIISNIL